MIESIDEQTRRFASGLTRAVRMITSDAPEFQVSIAGHDSWLATVRPEDDAAVTPTVTGVYSISRSHTSSTVSGGPPPRRRATNRPRAGLPGLPATDRTRSPGRRRARAHWPCASPAPRHPPRAGPAPRSRSERRCDAPGRRGPCRGDAERGPGPERRPRPPRPPTRAPVRGATPGHHRHALETNVSLVPCSATAVTAQPVR